MKPCQKRIQHERNAQLVDRWCGIDGLCFRCWKKLVDEIGEDQVQASVLEKTNTDKAYEAGKAELDTDLKVYRALRDAAIRILVAEEDWNDKETKTILQLVYG